MTKKQQRAEERLRRIMTITAEAVRKATAEDVAKMHLHVSYETNRKLGGIASVNLIPGYTCTMEACAHCGIDGCYAVKNLIRFGYDPEKNCVFKAWLENTILAMKDLPRFERELREFLDSYDGEFFRIHSAGDLFSVEYAEMYERVMLDYLRIQFLAFSKAWDVLRKVKMDGENAHIVPSGWTGCPVPEDIAKERHCSHCVEKNAEPPEGAVQCPGSCETCNACWMLEDLGKDVWFRKH